MFSVRYESKYYLDVLSFPSEIREGRNWALSHKSDVNQNLLSSVLKVEAESYLETSAHMYQTTRHLIKGDSNLNEDVFRNRSCFAVALSLLL